MDDASVPTLYHMNNSQSQRILWLLCELDIPFKLSLHLRQADGPRKGRAPEKLLETHPMGKSPQLAISDGRIIAESSAIAAYLIATYDTDKKFQGDGGPRNDWIRDEELTSFSGSTVGSLMLLQLLGKVGGELNGGFIEPEQRLQLTYLEAQLEGYDYFMGERPGRADFMLSWPLDLITARGYNGLAEYPKLRDWRKRCQDRAGWKQALEKGNGYNMNF